MVPVEQEKELGVPLLDCLFLCSFSFRFVIKVGELIYFVLGHAQEFKYAGDVFILEGVPYEVFWRNDKYIINDMFKGLYFLYWGDRLPFY